MTRKNVKWVLAFVIVLHMVQGLRVAAAGPHRTRRNESDVVQEEEVVSSPPPPPAPAETTTTTMTTTTESTLPGRTRACKVLAGIDAPLYDKYDHNITALVDMVLRSLEKVNSIFAAQILNKENGHGTFQDVYFRLSRLQIMFGSCPVVDYELENNCTSYREEYLKNFNRHESSEFCLAYMFTNIDFDNGTAGLANIETVCRPDHNTGFVTLLNHGQNKTDEDTALTLAHEIGHNFGAVHDNDINDEACKNQGFIMNEVQEDPGGNATRLHNRERFSPCSVSQMATKTLDKIISGDTPDCFVASLPYEPDMAKEAKEVEIAICGNKIQEPGETCDCGHTEVDCNDACCYPAVISASDRIANDSAIPCSRNRSHNCLHPPGVVFGVYVPFAVIAISVVILAVVLVRDWRGGKRCFTHITQGDIRIVRR